MAFQMRYIEKSLGGTKDEPLENLTIVYYLFSIYFQGESYTS